MMDYEMFKRVFAQEFVKEIPERFRLMGSTTDPVLKNNGVVKDCLRLSLFDTETGSMVNAVPSIYLDQVYADYIKCGSNMSVTLADAHSSFDHALNSVDRTLSPDLVRILASPEELKSRVYAQLVNKAANAEMLANAPHRDMFDLSVEYRIKVYENAEGLGSTLLTNDMFKSLGISEEELHNLAMNNTEQMFPVVMKPIMDVISEQTGMDLSGGMSQEERNQLYLISNTRYSNGAIAMASSEHLAEVSEQMGGGDLFVIPSSVHEVLCVRKEGSDVREVMDMIDDVNSNVVESSEFLSNSLYQYDAKSRTLSLAGEGRSLSDMNQEKSMQAKAI